MVKKIKDYNCVCSEDCKRDILQYGPLFNFFVVVILELFVAFDTKLKVYAKYLFRAVGPILTIIYLWYIYEVIKIECECSKDWRRKFITIYEIVLIVIKLLAICYFGYKRI